MVLTVIHIVFILFIITMGFWKGNVVNLTNPADPEKSPGGFFPYSIAGVFNGAAMVYLSYIGYDAVSTMAEEVKEPARDIPIGISGSVVLVTILYCLMAASMCMLLPYDAVNSYLNIFTFLMCKACPMVASIFNCGQILTLVKNSKV
jgi:amino acid transporter